MKDHYRVIKIVDAKERLVFDIEADGLLEDSKNIWCISGKYIDRSNSIFNKFNLNGDQLNLTTIRPLFKNKIVIGHNIVNYDLPMLKKFYGYDFIEEEGIENVVDTYILSKLLYPDRQMPKGCPDIIVNPVTKKNKRIGPHGLESWGYRVGHKKIEIHDWTVFTEDIIDRCDTDVLINELVYYALLKEAGIKND